MKATFHKFLVGASLVALAVFGMTVLSSDSSNDNTSVWAFSMTPAVVSCL